MTLPNPPQLTVTADDVPSRDLALTRAVHDLIPEALRRRTGISVTRQSGSEYDIAVDSSVPCGEIHERCNRSQNIGTPGA